MLKIWKNRACQSGHYLMISGMLFGLAINGISQDCLTTSRYFNIDSATKMTEHAGDYGGGSSVQYEIFLTVKKNQLKYFDSAWGHGTNALVILKEPKYKNPRSGEKFRKKRKLILVLNMRYNSDPDPERGYFPVYKKPVDCPQEIILRYKAKRKISYITLSKFTQLLTINLP